MSEFEQKLEDLGNTSVHMLMQNNQIWECIKDLTSYLYKHECMKTWF